MLATYVPILHWLAVHFGAQTNVSRGPWYNFWSGTGSDIGEYIIVVTVLAGFLHVLHRNTCHVGGMWPHGCWLPAIHDVEVNGVKHRVCHKHSGHPILRHHPNLGLHHATTQTFSP